MAALLSAPSLVHSRCPAPRRLAAAPAAQRRLRRRRAAGPVAAQKQQQQQPISEADLYHSVSGAPLAPPRRAGLAGQPLYVTVPLAFAGLIAVLRTAKFLKKRM